MTRGGGRLTRVALRLGLLLGGVAAVWGVHEAAAGSAAQAAERPPSGAVRLLTGTLSPVLDAVNHSISGAASAPVSGDRAGARPDRRVVTRPDGRTAAPATRPGSARTWGSAGRRTAPDARHHDRRSAPSARHDGRRSGADARHAGRRSAPNTRHEARRSGADARHEARRSNADAHGARWSRADSRDGTRRPVDPRRAATGPERRAGGGLGKALAPIRAGVLDPAAGALRPVTDPVRDRVLAPVAGALRPVTRPLGPILSPVWRAVEPVRRPLGPILAPLTPVSDLLHPPRGPVTTPPPGTNPPGKPPGTLPSASPPGKPPGTLPSASPPADAAGTTGRADRPAPRGSADTSGVPAHANGHAAEADAGLATRGPSDAIRTARPGQAGSGQPSRPGPTQTDVDRTPALPAPPGSAAAGSPGAGHGVTAVVGATPWAPPVLTGGRSGRADDPAPASRSPRPDTRPA
ncbi:hypothetical protein [Micromonospora sp. NPDC004551]|uniref:hypothetical protein n=1 Tax=Micromonospora sp. NPDC004551 TaxID=3154284 RepID=UPI0033AE512B